MECFPSQIVDQSFPARPQNRIFLVATLITSRLCPQWPIHVHKLFVLPCLDPIFASLRSTPHRLEYADVALHLRYLLSLPIYCSCLPGLPQSFRRFRWHVFPKTWLESIRRHQSYDVIFVIRSRSSRFGFNNLPLGSIKCILDTYRTHLRPPCGPFQPVVHIQPLRPLLPTLPLLVRPPLRYHKPSFNLSSLPAAFPHLPPPIRPPP